MFQVIQIHYVCMTLTFKKDEQLIVINDLLFYLINVNIKWHITYGILPYKTLEL